MCKIIFLSFCLIVFKSLLLVKWTFFLFIFCLYSFFLITLGKTKTMSHKSLYNRLKPEYLELFEKSNLKYPEITGRIIDALEQESFVTALVYSTVLDIKFTLGIDNPFEMFKDF